MVYIVTMRSNNLNAVQTNYHYYIVGPHVVRCSNHILCHPVSFIVYDIVPVFSAS